MSEVTEVLVLEDSNGRQLKSRFLTDDEAFTWTAKLKNDPFASDICQNYLLCKRRGWTLSKGRRYWLHKLAERQWEKDHPKPPEYSFPGVVEFLGRCAGKRKSGACVTFRNDGGVVQIRAYRGPRPDYEGSYWVNNGATITSGANELYGRLDKEGGFHTNTKLEMPVPPHALALLDELGNDPEGFIRQYGRASGECCFCAAKLDDPISVHFGYGPVCGPTYLLPWGKREMEKQLKEAQS